MADTVTVRACEGRPTPIHKSVATAPGNEQLLLQPGKTIEVAAGANGEPADSYIRRRIRAGDLEVVKDGSKDPGKNEPLPEVLPPVAVEGKIKR